MHCSTYLANCLVFMLVVNPSQPVLSGPTRAPGGRWRRSPWIQSRIRPTNHPLNEPVSSNNIQVSAAIMFGEGHVITFDGQYYKYPTTGDEGYCPHILARDHVRYSFIVLQTRRSITVYTSRTVVTVHHNNKVEVNNTGDYRDQPVLSWDGSVAVTNDNREVLIQTDVGVTIECHLNYKQCVFRMSSSLNNSTMGLLGTNDNDLTNDFTLRSGEQPQSLQDFINHYELTGIDSCRPHTPQTPGDLCPSHHTHTCQHLFQDSSSRLADCFNHVSSSPYMSACQHDARSCSVANKEEAVCGAVRAYVRMCRTRGVHIHVPNNCVACVSHVSGNTWREHPHKKLDVVVAVSKSTDVASGRQSLGVTLSNIIAHTGNNLRNQARVQNVRLGLLGYGGQNLLGKPHVYTFQGEPFTRHFSGAIWRDQLESLVTDGPTESGARDALQTALNYPFRHDAVKVIVLITGSAQALTQADLANLQPRLLERGVFLNVVTRSTLFQSPDIVGVRSDSQLLSTANSQQTATSNQYPADAVSQLVQATGGVMFDLNKLLVSNHHLLRHLSAAIIAEIHTDMRRCRSCHCRQTPVSESGAISCTTRVCV